MKYLGNYFPYPDIKYMYLYNRVTKQMTITFKILLEDSLPSHLFFFLYIYIKSGEKSVNYPATSLMSGPWRYLSSFEKG